MSIDINGTRYQDSRDMAEAAGISLDLAIRTHQAPG
jgi:hypothetical protein